MSPIDRLTYLVLSPQLEDEFTDAVWKARMRIVLHKLDEVKILRSGKLNLRRSIDKYSSSLSTLRYARARTDTHLPSGSSVMALALLQIREFGVTTETLCSKI
jgi:hypothetical protein